MYTVIRMTAGHDRNGNPRRVFVIFAEGEIIETIQEGYEGVAVLPEAYRRCWRGISFVTTPAEYRRLINRR